MSARRKTKMTKKEMADFNGQVKAFLLAEGATVRPDTGAMFDFELNTIVGKLRLFLYDGDSGYMTVFGRFDDIEAAKKLCDINPHSGKWNHHYGVVDVDDAVSDFKRKIAALTLETDRASI